MLRVSRKFFEAVKLNERPAYKLAWEAGIHPITLSRILHGHDRIYPNDARVVAVGKILGLLPQECFSDDEGEKSKSENRCVQQTSDPG